MDDRLDSLLATRTSRHLRLEDIERHGLPFSRVAIFGAGQRGLGLKRYFTRHGCETLVFIDNDPAKQGHPLDGLPTVSLARFAADGPDVPVCIASHALGAMARQLLACGRRDFFALPNLSYSFLPDIMERHGAALRRVCDRLADAPSKELLAAIVKTYASGDEGYLRTSPYEQYFHPLVRPVPGDVVIDGGAFDGDTVRRFFDVAAPRLVLAFEPFPETFARLEANTRAYGAACRRDNRALWSEARALRLTASDTAPAGNAVAPHGTTVIQATTIDATVRDLGLDRLDCIKLDVEGAERQALEGARESIARFRPKLQVCLYHALEDLWTLPLYLEAHFPGYAFYLGHHAHDPQETVLYAVFPG